MYYYVNILLTKNALNTFISNENNFVQNQLLRSADSISFSFIPIAYSALLCWSPASIDFNGAALNSFFQCSETRRSLDNAAIMSRPRTLSVSGMNGGVGWPGLRASAWWLEGLSSLFNPLLCPKTTFMSFFFFVINKWQLLAMQRDGWCGRGRGLQIMTRITLCLHFQLSPIADFACVVERQTAATFIVYFTQFHTTLIVSV